MNEAQLALVRANLYYRERYDNRWWVIDPNTFEAVMVIHPLKLGWPIELTEPIRLSWEDFCKIYEETPTC